MGIERDVSIRFKTTYEGKGTEQATAGVKQVEQAVKQATPAVKDLKTGTDAAGASQEQLATAARKATQSFEPLHAAAQAIRHPLIALGAALGYLTQLIREKIKAFNDAGAASARYGTEIDAQRIAMDVARGTAVDYAAAIQKGAEAAQMFKTHLDTLNISIAATAAGQKEFIDLQRQIAELAVKVRQARGEIGGVEAANLIAGIGLGADKQAAQVDDQAMVAKWEGLNRAIGEGKAKLSGRGDALNKAKNELVQFQEDEKSAGPRRAKELQDSKERAAVLEEEKAKAQQRTWWEWIQSGGSRDGSPLLKKRIEQRVAGIQAKIDDEQTIQRQILEQDRAAGLRGKELQDRAATAETQFSAGTTSVRTLEEQRNTLGGQILQSRLRRQALDPMRDEVNRAQGEVNEAEERARQDKIKEREQDRARKREERERGRGRGLVTNYNLETQESEGALAAGAARAGARAIASAIADNTDIILDALRQQGDSIARVAGQHERTASSQRA